MNIPKTLSAAGVTPIKIAVIGVLAVILLIVIVIQSPGSPEPSAHHPTNTSEQSANSPRPPNRNNRQRVTDRSAAAVETTLQEWTDLSLETVLAHDPFAAPAWARTSERIDNSSPQTASDANVSDSNADRRLLADLKAEGVSVVMMAGGKRVAKVGQTELHEGDRIGGFVVQEISTDGVVLVGHQAH